MSSYEATVSAICYSIIAEQFPDAQPQNFPNNRIVNLVLEQTAQVPDWMRLPLKLVTLAFRWETSLFACRRFRLVSPETRLHQIKRWRNSTWSVRRDCMRLYEHLTIFGWYSLAHAECGSC